MPPQLSYWAAHFLIYQHLRGQRKMHLTSTVKQDKNLLQDIMYN